MPIQESGSFANHASAALREQATRLEKVGMPDLLGPWALRFDDLNSGFEVVRHEIAHATAGGDRCVYVFALTDPAAVPLVRTAMEKITRDKKEKTGAFAANQYDAKYNAGARESLTLYVGSSFATGKRTRTLVTRLAQHLGLSNTTTYAMHLAQWAGRFPGSVLITVYQYPNETCRDDILAIEDYLSVTLDPLLGRRGRAR